MTRIIHIPVQARIRPTKKPSATNRLQAIQYAPAPKYLLSYRSSSNRAQQQQFYSDGRVLRVESASRWCNSDSVTLIASPRCVNDVTLPSNCRTFCPASYAWHTLKSFFWPQIAPDIHCVVQSYTSCARDNATYRHRHLMQLLRASKPLEYVAMNIVGLISRTI